MTRKTNFFHSHRGVVARPLRPTSNQPIVPAAALPDEAPAAIALAPARRRWWTLLSEPRWPGRGARDGAR